MGHLLAQSPPTATPEPIVWTVIAVLAILAAGLIRIYLRTERWWARILDSSHDGETTAREEAVAARAEAAAARLEAAEAHAEVADIRLHLAACEARHTETEKDLMAAEARIDSLVAHLRDLGIPLPDED